MSADEPSTRRWSEPAVLGLTALAVVVADQLTKAAVEASLAVGDRASVIGDLVILWHVQNTGSAFSLFQFEGALVLFYVVHVVALGMVAWFARAFAGRHLVLFVVLGVLLGGSLGNLADRLRQGYVTDFISVGFGDVRFPTWNVADAGITVGIILLVGYLAFLEPRAAEASA